MGGKVSKFRAAEGAAAENGTLLPQKTVAYNGVDVPCSVLQDLPSQGGDEVFPPESLISERSVIAVFLRTHRCQMQLMTLTHFRRPQLTGLKCRTGSEQYISSAAEHGL